MDESGNEMACGVSCGRVIENGKVDGGGGGATEDEEDGPNGPASYNTAVDLANSIDWSLSRSVVRSVIVL